MEKQKSCSKKKHSEINATSYCLECNLYLCNKCTNAHIEDFDSHHNYKIDINNQDLFIGLCNEPNHKSRLDFYCKSHNKLCCAACLCKIKENGNGQHFDCDVCLIQDIENEKKNKLKENIKILEESSEKIEDSLNKLKEIFEKINESKEELKLKILNCFTKIRNIINSREDELLLELDNLYDNTFFKEDIIKKGEKLPKQIKIFLEKGKLLDNEWDNNGKKLIERINDCINIENNIKNIIEINTNIEKYNSKKVNVKFLSEEDEKITELTKSIKKFGEILKEENNNFKFKFEAGDNYTISNNNLIATKGGGDAWNCIIYGNREIPKDELSKWKIKINKDKKKSMNMDIFIGIGPKEDKGDLYDRCWSICSHVNSIISLQLKKDSSNYGNHNEIIKEGDIIEVIVDRKLGNLSFAVNNVNYGIACSSIPKEDILYPTVILYEQGLSVEIL